MDRSFWLSLMVLGLCIAVLLSLRAATDGVVYLQGAALATEIEALNGAPSSDDLMTRTTEAAGCLYGNRPPVFTCWYAWAHPERSEYLALIAERVRADSGGSALGYLGGALPFWLLALFSGWKATRPSSTFRHKFMTPRVDPPRTHGRITS
jgi:hypothetical protein